MKYIQNKNRESRQTAQFEAKMGCDRNPHSKQLARTLVAGALAQV